MSAQHSWRMPDSLFRSLTPEEEQQFRSWARDNWKPGDPVLQIWHPVVRDEIEKIQAEQVTCEGYHP